MARNEIHKCEKLKKIEIDRSSCLCVCVCVFYIIQLSEAQYQL